LATTKLITKLISHIYSVSSATESAIMTDDSMSPFVELPLELIYHIFSIAAATSRRSCISLCRVASWARHIAQPHLPHTVVIKNHISNSQFLRFLKDPLYKAASPNFRPPLIRNVWMEIASNRIISIFNECDNLEHLALTDEALLWLIHSSPILLDNPYNSMVSEAARSRDHDLQLTMIFGRWTNYEYNTDGVTQESALLSRITHVRLADIAVRPTHRHLVHFTRLSHLAVPFYNLPLHRAFLYKLLDFQSLKMLVVVIVTSCVNDRDRVLMEELVAGIRKIDTRIYLTESSYRGSDIWEEWEDEMRGAESIWDKAVRHTREYEAKG